MAQTGAFPVPYTKRGAGRSYRDQIRHLGARRRIAKWRWACDTVSSARFPTVPLPRFAVGMEELCCVAEEAQCAHPSDTKVYRAYMLSVQYEYQLSLTDPRDKIVP